MTKRKALLHCLLFLGIGVTALNRGHLRVSDTDVTGLMTQSVHVSNATTDGGCLEDCDCHAEGRCKPCSRFAMSRQLRECLRTGYRQWAYCSKEKVAKYVSCHYSMDPSSHGAFWLFQISALLTGSASLAVVQWRRARIERLVAHRIEQQIRA